MVASWSLVGLLAAGVVCGVFGFNLEPGLPVVKKGAPESFFGFSVALHQSNEERYDGTIEQKGWLLVGAPLGKNLQPNTEKSGALWKCPITTLEGDCVQVVTDGYRDPVTEKYKRKDDSNLYPPSKRELKEGQWMGVTVRSQGPGRKVLVCAHRYIERGAANDYHWGHGLCYTLKQDLEFSEVWQPCVNKDNSRAHEQYGYCQAGTSGILTDDDSVLIGLPGPYTWRGTVYSVNVSNSYLQRDKTQYFGPVTGRTSPVDKYSYLGMAVAHGRFFPEPHPASLVGGAPRSKGSGQVVFFSRERIGQKTLRKDLILDGEMFSSQFGYELCALDFNSDGMTDLVVGAPFHFTETSGGAIYIYKTPGTGLTEDTRPVRKVGEPDSRYGFALANLGDLNKDGYQDLAVGAPFEGHGVVYIYLGSREGLGDEPAQRIASEDVAEARAPITFGYSLGGGTDIDRNGYPDLLVGSFCNDTVVLIRARPIVGIVTKVEGMSQLENIDPSGSQCDALPDSGEKCVKFEACFKMESLEQLNTDVVLEYRLEAETFRPGRRFSRVRFRDGLPERKHIVTKELPLSADNTRRFVCNEEIMFVKQQTRDIQTPIPLKLTYELQQRQPRQPYPGARLPNIDAFPILNKQEASKIFYAKFIKDCGRDDVCQSELVVEPQFDLRKDEAGYWVLERGPAQELRVNTSVVNRGEPAYDARLFITHPPEISFIAKEPRDNIVCTTPDSHTVVCYLGNPMKGDWEREDMVLRFDVRQLDDEDNLITMSFSTNTTSEEVNRQADTVIRARVAKRSEVSVSGVARPEQSFYGGEVRGESVTKYLDQVGSPVLHTYEVYNTGPSTVDWVDVQIEWPAQVQSGGEQGKWLLYMTRPPIVKGNGECFLDQVHVNPLNLKQRQEEPSLAGSVLGAYVGTYQTSSSTSHETGGSSGSDSSRDSSNSSSSNSSTSITTSRNYTSTSSSSSSSQSSSSRGGISGSGSLGGRDRHDHLVVEDTRTRKTDLSGGLNSVESRHRKPGASADDDDDYRRRRPLNGDRGGSYSYERTTSRRGHSRIGGDKEDDYRGATGGEDGSSSSSSSETRRTYQTSQSATGAGGRGGSSIGGSIGSSSSSSNNSSGGGGRYNSNEELERRYGAGQGFRTTTFDSGTGSRHEGVGSRHEGADSRYGGAGSRYEGAGSRYEGAGSRYEGAGSRYEGAGSRYEGAGSRYEGAGSRYEGGGGGSRSRNYSSSSSFDSRYGSSTGQRGGSGVGGRYQGGSRHATAAGDYDGDLNYAEYDGPLTGRPRVRPGGRRRGYYRRRRPLGGGGGGGGNQSYTFRRQYESRRPYGGSGVHPTDDLASRRDDLSSRRIAGGTERVENVQGGTRREYSAHRELDGGYEREEISEEERRTRREREERERQRREGEGGRERRQVRLRRRKREQEMVVMPETVKSQSGEVHQVIYMDCARNSAKCIKFRCRIHQLPQYKYALVHVQGRIWNSTLVEDYPDVSWVSIKSRATLHMDPALEKLQDITDDTASAESVAYPDLPREAEGGGVPIWIIIVSVLAGLLLLAIIALILWKLGFFKRRRPDPTLKSNISR